DTPARQNASKLAFALAYSYFGCALDTPARQNASKLAFALAYSYLWLRRRYFASEKNASKLAFFSRLIRIFAIPLLRFRLDFDQTLQSDNLIDY
ncbi:MAG: hypothetical protein K2J51_03390, partial [Alistipes sp.]|nr:hypothetical protein [Alistipes sp.]